MQVTDSLEDVKALVKYEQSGKIPNGEEHSFTLLWDSEEQLGMVMLLLATSN